MSENETRPHSPNCCTFWPPSLPPSLWEGNLCPHAGPKFLKKCQPWFRHLALLAAVDGGVMDPEHTGCGAADPVLTLHPHTAAEQKRIDDES